MVNAGLKNCGRAELGYVTTYRDCAYFKSSFQSSIGIARKAEFLYLNTIAEAGSNRVIQSVAQTTYA